MALDDISRFIDFGTLQRGRGLVSADAVTLESVHPEHSKLHLSGSVVGTRGDIYSVTAEVLIDGGRVLDFSSRCDCPIYFRCKHAVALYITYCNYFNLGGTAPDQWRRRLERYFPSSSGPFAPNRTPGLFEDPSAAQSARASNTPAATPPDGYLVFVEREGQTSFYHPGGTRIKTDRRVFIHPARLAKTGKKLAKTGVTWTNLANRRGQGEMPRNQLQAFYIMTEIIAHRNYLQSEIPLDYLDTTLLWTGFSQLLASGVQLVDESMTPVIIHDEPTETVVEFASSGDSSIQLRPGISAAPNLEFGTIGRTAHGVYWRDDDNRLHLAQLHTTETPISPHAGYSTAWDSLRHNGPVDIPRTHWNEFKEEFLHRVESTLRWTITDDDIDIAPPPPPSLGVHITGQLHGDIPYISYHFGLVHHGLRSSNFQAFADGASRDEPCVAAAEDAGLLLADASLAGLPALTFLDEEVPRLQAHGVEVEFDEVSEEVNSWQPAENVDIHVGTELTGNDWLSLHVTVTVDGIETTMAEVIAALASPERLLVLPGGKYVHLDSPEYDDFVRLLAEARALSDPRRKSVGVPSSRTSWWDELEALESVSFQPDEWLEKALAAARTPIGELPVPDTLNATLRPYQVEGFRWLASLRRRGLAGLLADDMGLGKTIQVLAMLADALPADPATPAAAPEAAAASGPWLVIAPTSVVSNWVAEATRFTPTLKFIAIEATEKRRGTTLAEAVAGADVVVTSYTLLRLEAEAYRKLKPAGVILDEAQTVKNPASKAHGVIGKLGAPHVFAITGTPIENSLKDAWALFTLTNPGLLGGFKQFREYFERPITQGDGDPERMAQLRARVAPFMLRRRKGNVALDLPPIQRQVRTVKLSPAHRRIYDVHFARERQRVLRLIADDAESNRFEILAALTRLRQLAIAPALVTTDDTAADAAGSSGTANAAAAASANAAVGSSKLDALHELLDGILAEGHRVLVFSQFTRYLQMVSQSLTQHSIAHSYLDGTTTNRRQVIAEFTEGDNPVFLISLKAGGVGLNLTAASYVIVLDPWWNPAAEAQAIDRAHRIGQQLPVTVYRLIAEDTIEEKVLALQQAKQELMDDFLRPDGESGQLGGASLDADDIRKLLG